MTIYDSFAVVDVPFPFVDSPRQKNRPALVISSPAFQVAGGAVVLVMITSAGRSSWEHDVVLVDWSAAGLKKPCVVRWKLFTLDGALVAGFRGHLSDRDVRETAKGFAKVISLADIR